MNALRKTILTAMLVIGAAALSAAGQSETVTNQELDAEIQADVTRALERNSRVDQDDITVVVEEGVVTLMGDVASLREEEAAIRTARTVLGVTDVIEQLNVVASGESPAETFVEVDVRSALETSADVDASGIVVDVQGSELTLLGSVRSLYARERAEEIVLSLVGVEEVTNELSVVPTEVEQALARNAIVDETDVSVVVSDGVVVLSGTVDSAAERKEARTAALLTPGVVELEDQLELVQIAGDITPSDIREVVIEQLEWDVRVDASDIDVVVEGPRVTLSGTVESARAKQVAVESAESVRGVTVVRDQLQVELVDEIGSRTNVTRAVRNNLRFNTGIEIEDLEVTRTDGVVTISGTVEEAWQRQEAERIAANTRGVAEVINGIVVLPETTRTDTTIEADIKEAIRESSFVDPDGISVDVTDSVVTLTGEVETWFEKETTVDFALQTEGVTVVEDELRVRE
jgi:osmotically-inducible protein OsmY